MNCVKPEFINVYEQRRVYHFADTKITLEGVISINVSKSGTHRLNMSDGRKVIVPPGWVLVEFVADDWTF